MEPERQEYKGHYIDLRVSDIGKSRTLGVKSEPELELLIDSVPVRYSQLPDGSYALHEYAYDWSDNLIDLSKKFIEYRIMAERIWQKTKPSKEQ